MNGVNCHNPDFITNEKNATKLEDFMGEYITKTVQASKPSETTPSLGLGM